jgi:hypothetical protein
MLMRGGRRLGPGRWVESVAGIVLLSAVACAKEPTKPTRLSSPSTFRPDIDDAQVWSHDGRQIAYHRRYRSADGPPGVYIISRWGGAPRFLALGNFWWPKELHFSPDDRYLVGNRDFTLIVIDVATATVTSPMYTPGGAHEPDWSPDGKTILYFRAGFTYTPGQPQDSIGLHFFEPSTGKDRALHYHGGVVFGTNPLWSPDGREIALIDDDGTRERISIVRSDGTELRVMVEGQSYDHLHWYTPSVYGRQALLFEQTNAPGGGTYIVNRDGSGFSRAPFRLNVGDALSPDGSEVVTSGWDPNDSLAVLFVARTGDPSGASRRQLTHWAPAPGAVVTPIAGVGPGGALGPEPPR